MSRSWATLEELEAAVVEYQTTWWRSNPDAMAVLNDHASHPGLLGHVAADEAAGAIVTTERIYRTYRATPGLGGYLSRRAAIHARIVADCVPAAGATAGTPRAFFTIGCPGVGKTSRLRQLVDRYRTQTTGPAAETRGGGPARYSIVDADQVRQALPEYADGLGAFVVVPECYDVTYDLVFPEALTRRADIVYDTLGRSSIRPNLQLLHDEGYEIHIVHGVAPVEVCSQRTRERALSVDGRVVHVDTIRSSATEASQTLDDLLADGFPVAGWVRVDTTDRMTAVAGTAEWLRVVRT